MDNVGAVVGPLLATLLLAASVLIRGVFWVAVIPGVIATISVLLVREPPRTPPPPPDVATSSAGSAHEQPRGPDADPHVAYLAVLGLFSLANPSDAFLLLRAREVGLTTRDPDPVGDTQRVEGRMGVRVGGDAADRLPRARLIAGG